MTSAPGTQQNSLLGIIAVGLVAAALVSSLIAIGPMLNVVAQILATTTDPANIDSTYLQQLIMEQAPMAGILLNVGSLLGIAGLVTGIVATATRRGRGWGIAAIIGAVVAPFIVVIVMVAMLMGQLPT